MKAGVGRKIIPRILIYYYLNEIDISGTYINQQKFFPPNP